MFAVPAAGVSRIVLRIGKIQAPRTLKQIKELKEQGKAPEPNYHVPSFKNSKHWVTKDPKGRPLKRPFLITSPEFQKWMEKAALLLESQLLSLLPTHTDATLPEPSRLLQILSLLPADDSVRELTEGSWKVQKVNPGEEGAEIVIERLT